MPTPSEPPSLAEFLGLRDRMRSERVGHGGFEVCSLLGDTLDGALRGLGVGGTDVAVVAIGGYGRGELSLFSDIDLMLLHDIADPAEAASRLFRPLWDAGLRVGHSVRTLREAAAAARERFDTQTTLLTGRLVDGSDDLFERLTAEITSVTRARPLRRHLVEEERARRVESPFLPMAPDVKTGRGGLRVLHGFEWERRREALIGRFSADSPEDEAGARETLLQVRNGLHAVAGRAHDVYSVEVREAVARWMGRDVFEVSRGLVAAMQAVDRLATQRWPEVMTRPVSTRRIRGRLARRPALPSTDHPPTADELTLLLQSGEEGRLAFDRLWEDGHLDDLFPEWEVVIALPQLAPFHAHPVDVHLWRTVAEMSALAGEGHYGGVAEELGRPDVLALAAFLHDIGKGHGGDHSNVGGVIARALCDRLGLPTETVSLVEGAVRHHLLLAETATRRDLDDPAVLDEVAVTVGGLEQLQVLYLLTVADSRATGPTMWSDWKAVLLRTLFTRCAGRFGADRPAPSPEVTRGEVLAELDEGRKAEAIAHLDAMPAEYLRSATAEEVVWHLELIEGLADTANLGIRSDEPHEQVVVVARDHPGLRRLVAAAFAANGIDVLEARLHTRDDGVVVDAFRVRDDRTGGQVRPERIDQARSDIAAAMAGELDTGARVAARAASYADVSGILGEPAVSVGYDGATGGLVVTIKCSDRVGRLAEILTVLEDCGLEIHLAKLDSRGDELVDTFHVRGGVAAPGGLEALIGASLSP